MNLHQYTFIDKTGNTEYKINITYNEMSQEAIKNLVKVYIDIIDKNPNIQDKIE